MKLVPWMAKAVSSSVKLMTTVRITVVLRRENIPGANSKEESNKKVVEQSQNVERIYWIAISQS